MSYAGRIDFKPQYRYKIFCTDKISERRDFRAFILDFPDMDNWTLFNVKSARDIAIVMFSQPSHYGYVPGDAVDIGNIYFVCGYRYLIYFVADNKEEAIINEIGWHLDKEFDGKYGTLLVFRRKDAVVIK